MRASFADFRIVALNALFLKDALLNIRPEFPENCPCRGCPQSVGTSDHCVLGISATCGIPRVGNESRSINSGEPRIGGHLRAAICAANEHVDNREACAVPKGPLAGILAARIFAIRSGNAEANRLANEKTPVTRRGSYGISVPSLPPFRWLIECLSIGRAETRRKEVARTCEGAQVDMKALAEGEVLGRNGLLKGSRLIYLHLARECSAIKRLSRGSLRKERSNSRCAGAVVAQGVGVSRCASTSEIAGGLCGQSRGRSEGEKRDARREFQKRPRRARLKCAVAVSLSVRPAERPALSGQSRFHFACFPGRSNRTLAKRECWAVPLRPQ